MGSGSSEIFTPVTLSSRKRVSSPEWLGIPGLVLAREISRLPDLWPTTCSSPGSGVGCWGPGAQVLIVHSGQASPLPLSPTPAPEKEKRDSQLIIDSLRDTLDERNATVESLQRALDKAEMLCSTLKVSPQPPWAQVGGEIQPSSWAHHCGLVFCVCLGQYRGLLQL